MKSLVFGKLGTLYRKTAVALDAASGRFQYDMSLVWWWPINWLWICLLTPFALLHILLRRSK